MCPDPRRTRGALGEQIAADHLRDAGYLIVDRNFRVDRGEIDLIAADADALIFCEVKTRVAGGRSGPALPLDAIGAAKRRKIRTLATRWLHERRAAIGAPSRRLLRFDAIGVTLTPGGRLLALEHLEDAF